MVWTLKSWRSSNCCYIAYILLLNAWYHSLFYSSPIYTSPLQNCAMHLIVLFNMRLVGIFRKQISSNYIEKLVFNWGGEKLTCMHKYIFTLKESQKEKSPLCKHVIAETACPSPMIHKHVQCLVVYKVGSMSLFLHWTSHSASLTTTTSLCVLPTKYV